MATSGTGAIATFGDMASITGVTISGTYDANQCIKYSDIGVTYSYPYTFIIKLTRTYTGNNPNIYIVGAFSGKVATSYNTAPVNTNGLLRTFGTGTTCNMTLWSTMGSGPLIFNMSTYSSVTINITGTGSYSASVTYIG